MSRSSLALLLILGVLLGFLVLLSPLSVHTGSRTISDHTLLGQSNSSGSSGEFGVSCPAGSTLSWGPISLNCFQSLNLAEGVALLIGITIAVYIYWNMDEAELPGEAEHPPVTAEEEVAALKAKEGHP